MPWPRYSLSIQCMSFSVAWVIGSKDLLSALFYMAEAL